MTKCYKQIFTQKFFKKKSTKRLHNNPAVHKKGMCNLFTFKLLDAFILERATNTAMPLFN